MSNFSAGFLLFLLPRKIRSKPGGGRVGTNGLRQSLYLLARDNFTVSEARKKATWTRGGGSDRLGQDIENSRHMRNYLTECSVSM